MTSQRIGRFGSWNSPVTSDIVSAAAVRIDQVALDGADIYWVETHPWEGGRGVIVRLSADGRRSELTPPPYSARTLVHEYGGGAFAVRDGTVYFSNLADQRLYRQDPGDAPVPVTAPGPLRYADAVVDSLRQRIICVAEDHTTPGREAVNTLVSLGVTRESEPLVLVSGHDFYASPRLSPDGRRLAWLAWSHPNMPWDGNELWIGDLSPGGALERTEMIAGSRSESIFQPEWSPAGELYFVSDRTGWSNLYRWRNRQAEPLCEMQAEFGFPQWVFGMSTYGFLSATQIVCAYRLGGLSHLACLNVVTQSFEPFNLPYSFIGDVRAASGRVVLYVGAPAATASIVEFDPETRRIDILRHTSHVRIDEGYLAPPESVEFLTEGGIVAHAFFYAPRNRDYVAPHSERPPLLVRCHSGPTGAFTNTLDLETQFWTSRGTAVLDVNYRGSVGYGRAYREHLDGQWGIVDVQDCVNAAQHLIRLGRVDANRIAIRGRSAGGFTALRAATSSGVFKGAVSYYGISDLGAMVRETHKFESHYLERLVGSYSENSDLYRERSPIFTLDKLSCPLLLLQGLEDKIVPPNQAEMIVAAAVKKRLPVALVTFASEQHGIRRAENIKRALEAELYFYSKLFGFEPADPIEPVPIANLHAMNVQPDRGD